MLKYTFNSAGVFLTRKGEVFKPTNLAILKMYLATIGLDGSVEYPDFAQIKDKNNTAFEPITPKKDISGYSVILDEDLQLLKAPSSKIIVDGRPVSGKYLHRMMVFTFGDRNGRKYNSHGWRSVIDHVDMNHSNNTIDNLELVSQGVNLFRSYYLLGDSGSKKRYEDYVATLDETDKQILKTEIELDIAGKY